MQISKRKIPKKEWDRIWNILMMGIMKSSSRGDLNVLLLGVLGKNERVMMAKRLMIAVLDLSGWTVEEIAQNIGSSKSTVNKFQQIVRNNDSFRELVMRLFPNEINRPASTEEGLFSELVDKMFDGYRNRKILYE